MQEDPTRENAFKRDRSDFSDNVYRVRAAGLPMNTAQMMCVLPAGIFGSEQEFVETQ